MKSVRMMTAVCMAVILAVQTAITAFASYSEVLDEIFRQDMSKRGVTDFYDGLEYCRNDGAAYSYAMLCGTDGADRYVSTVTEYTERLIDSDRFVKPTDLQKAAITLALFGGCTQELMDQAVYLNEDFDRQGFNAYIWGLIALNCTDIEAPENALHTRASLCGYIISKQLEDGGFALKGTAADTDMTAAVIYALAPLKDDPQVSKALEKAERCLTSLQLESGGFSGMGIENSESTAQAIIAFTALDHGIGDDRVSRALSALMKYKTTDGFAHLSGDDSSGIATVQAAQALTALELHEQGRYLFSAAWEDVQTSVPDETEHDGSLSETSENAGDGAIRADGNTIKILVISVLAVAGGVLLIIWLVRGRKDRILIVFSCVLLVGGIVMAFVDIRTPEEYYSEAAEGDGLIVMVSADCTAALENPGKAQRELLLPADGQIVSAQAITVPEGATAFDALVEAARIQKITLDYSDSLTGAYISGIHILYEFDYGSESGWLYRVNGELPSVACSEYQLSDGDVVEFVYTCELGR